MLIKDRSKWSRRSLLTAAGGAVLLPFVPMLETHAAGGGQSRFIVFYHGHGVPKTAWRPTGTTDNWQLGEVLMPLTPFKERLTIVDGLTNQGGVASGSNGHVYASRTLLNNTSLTSDNQPGGISIDQAVANQIGLDTRYKSLEAGVYGTIKGVNSTGYKEALEAETNPVALFDRIFGDAEIDDTQLARLKADRGSVIDLVRSNLQAVQGRVASADKVKIERHLDHIRTIENGLATLGELPGGCRVPTEPNLDGQGPTEQFRDVAHLHADLLAAALACNLTKVATLGLNTVQIRLDYLPNINDTCHHIHHDGSNPNSGVYHDRFKTLVTEYASLLAYFLQRLDEYVDPDGGTVLDNSLVVWGTWYGGGNHGHDDLGFVLAGGAGGALATNGFLRYDGDRTGDLWTAAGQLMGLEIDGFGDYSSGPLSGLL